MDFCIKCHEKTILAALIIIIILILIIWFPPHNNKNATQVISSAPCKTYDTEIIDINIPPPNLDLARDIAIEPIMRFNRDVKEYDIRNLEDPLVPPTARPPKHIFRSLYGNPLFDYPTRGPLDDYTYMGNLVRTSTLVNSESSYVQPANNIIELMGRQKYPNSTTYDYYVLAEKGNMRDSKIHIRTKRHEELYDGDVVNIPELGNIEYTFRKNKSYLNQYY